MSAAQADGGLRHRCQRAGIERVVELQQEPPDGLPCAVLYHKPDEDQRTTYLWRARADPTFCKSRYDEFVEKLETKLDWVCTSEDEVALAPVALEEIQPLRIEPDQPRRLPALAAARATADSTPSDVDVLRERIPSGPYRSLVEEARTAFCPPDGVFIWNTRNPDVPVLEIGRTAHLSVDLGNSTMGESLVLQPVQSVAAVADEFEITRLSRAMDESAGGSVETLIELTVRHRDSVEQQRCRYSLGG